jgi:hypothetical protein
MGTVMMHQVSIQAVMPFFVMQARRRSATRALIACLEKPM